MGSLSIKNARVFDGEALSEPRTVFVTDGVISDTATVGSETFDAEGGTLLPGLIDGHLHIDRPEQAATLAHWGVTTALDMGAKDPSVIDGLRGSAGVADIRTAGFPAAPITGTHIARLGYPASAGISAPGEAAAWVAARIAAGSDFIKLLLEPPIPGQPEPLSSEAAAAIVMAAHAAGKGARYTRGRGPLQLVFKRRCADKRTALRLEYAIKQLPRPEKLALTPSRLTTLARALATTYRAT